MLTMRAGRLNDIVILRSISILLVVFVHSFYILYIIAHFRSFLIDESLIMVYNDRNEIAKRNAIRIIN